MATQYQRKSVTRLLITLVLSSLLLACSLDPASQRLPDRTPNMFSTLDKSAEHYRLQAQKASQADAFTWQVLATRAWLQQENTLAASNQINRLQQTALAEQLPVLTLLQAEVALVTGHHSLAEQQLASLNLNTLAAEPYDYYLQLQARRLTQQQQPIAAADMLVQRNAELSGNAQLANLEHIQQLLSEASIDELRTALNHDYQPDTLIWLRLMTILVATNTDAEQRNWQLQYWKNSYPDHPAQRFLPADFDADSMAAVNAYQPQHIGVLLPLSGKLSAQAEAIRNGIASAHQGQLSQLSFFDTQSQDMSSLYQQLQQAGVDFIIGPLLKENVESLANLGSAIPQLALNMPEQPLTSPHNYYFALSPEAEAAEAALFMWEQGHQQPLVFAPNNALGRRSSKEFNLRWQQLTGQAARVAYFSNKEAIESDVRRALKTKPSLAEVGVTQAVTDHHALPTPGPIDSVFMASNATETRFILPYFDFVRDSRAERFPTYVTSRSYTPSGGAPISELNGVQLADMPWLFGSALQLKERVDQQWPNSSSSWLRLFALGYDAMTLIPQLTDLRSGGAPVPALTGDISINEQGVIERRLQWMEYRDGLWQQALEEESAEFEFGLGTDQEPEYITLPE